MGDLDIHTHFIAAPLLDRIRQGEGPGGVALRVRAGEERISHPDGFSYPLARFFYDVDARLRAMDEAGIDAAVLSISPDLFLYGTPTADGVRHCAEFNEALAEVVRAHPDRLSGVAALPMQDPSAARDELIRAVTTLGLRGAQVGPVVNGVWLDDQRFLPLYRTAAELDVPLVVHPYYLGPRPDLADYYLVNLLGNPVQTTTMAARMILSGMLDAVPRLRLVLMHGGGFLPYQIGRLDHGWKVRSEAQGCVRPPSSYLHRFSYDTLTHAPGALGLLLDTVGQEAVLYGTDAPFDMGGGTLTEQLSGLAVDPGVREAISCGNARRLFGL